MILVSLIDGASFWKAEPGYPEPQDIYSWNYLRLDVIHVPTFIPRNP